MKNDISFFSNLDICKNCPFFYYLKNQSGRLYICQKASGFGEIPNGIVKFNPEVDRIDEKERKCALYLDKRCEFFKEQYISFINSIPEDEIDDYKLNDNFN